MITKFSCVNIASEDPERLVRFYEDVLGIPVLYRDVGEYDGVGFGFIKDAPAFCVWDANRWGMDRNSKGPVCLAFGCDDHDRVYGELRAKGVEVEPPRTVPWGDGKELFVRDPDGNTVYIL